MKIPFPVSMIPRVDRKMSGLNIETSQIKFMTEAFFIARFPKTWDW